MPRPVKRKRKKKSKKMMFYKGEEDTENPEVFARERSPSPTRDVSYLEEESTKKKKKHKKKKTVQQPAWLPRFPDEIAEDQDNTNSAFSTLLRMLGKNEAPQEERHQDAPQPVKVPTKDKEEQRARKRQRLMQPEEDTTTAEKTKLKFTENKDPYSERFEQKLPEDMKEDVVVKRKLCTFHNPVLGPVISTSTTLPPKEINVSDELTN